MSHSDSIGRTVLSPHRRPLACSTFPLGGSRQADRVAESAAVATRCAGQQDTIRVQQVALPVSLVNRRPRISPERLITPRVCVAPEVGVPRHADPIELETLNLYLPSISRRLLAARPPGREASRPVASDIRCRERSASFTTADLRKALATSYSARMSHAFKAEVRLFLVAEAVWLKLRQAWDSSC